MSAGDEMTLMPVGPGSIADAIGEDLPATDYIFVYEAMGVRNA